MNKVVFNNKYLPLVYTFVTIRACFFILNHLFNIYILIYKVNESTINTLLNIALIISILLFMPITTNKKIKYLLRTIVSLFLILTLYINLLANEDITYFYFSSKDEKSTLVVEERRLFLSGFCKFYKKEKFIFVKYLKQSITFDDDCNIFSQKKYILDWTNNNSIKLRYAEEFSDKKDDYQTIYIKLK